MEIKNRKCTKNYPQVPQKTDKNKNPTDSCIDIIKTIKVNKQPKIEKKEEKIDKERKN